jgi:hypothetical protein
MRGSGILIMGAGLALGVVLAITLTAPGEARPKQSPTQTPQRPVTQDFPEVGGQASEVKDRKSGISGPQEDVKGQGAEASTQTKPRPVAQEEIPAAPPADGQKIELADGLEVHWVRGGKEISAWRRGNRVWSRELAFSVADVVRGTSPNELRVGSVDALSHVLLDGLTGKVANMTGARQAGDADVAKLMAQVRTLHADGLARMRAGDGKGVLAACDKMGELANRLAEAKQQNEAFHIWAAAKKLRRAVAPEQIGKEIPKEQQPGPEDLEF